MTMTIPTIPSLPAGYIVTPADLNNLAYCCTFLYTKPIARIRDAAGGQSISTSAISVNFATKDIDTDGMWSSSAPTKLTIQTPGWYKLRYAVAVTTGTTNRVNAQVKSTTGANNPQGSGVVSAAYWGAYTYAASGNTEYAGASGVWPFYLYAGDSLSVLALTDNGVNTAVTAPSSGNNGGSYFSLEYVSIEVT
jgi:hypothetical protein